MHSAEQANRQRYIDRNLQQLIHCFTVNIITHFMIENPKSLDEENKQSCMQKQAIALSVLTPRIKVISQYLSQFFAISILHTTILPCL